MVVLSEDQHSLGHRTVMDITSLEKQISDAIENQLKGDDLSSRIENVFQHQISEIEAEHRSLNEAFDALNSRLEDLLKSSILSGGDPTHAIMIDDDEEANEPFKFPATTGISNGISSPVSGSTTQNINTTSDGIAPNIYLTPNMPSIHNSSTSRSESMHETSTLSATLSDEIETVPSLDVLDVSVEVVEEGIALRPTMTPIALHDQVQSNEERIDSSTGSDGSSDLELLGTSIYVTPKKTSQATSAAEDTVLLTKLTTNWTDSNVTSATEIQETKATVADLLHVRDPKSCKVATKKFDDKLEDLPRQETSNHIIDDLPARLSPVNLRDSTTTSSSSPSITQQSEETLSTSSGPTDLKSNIYANMKRRFQFLPDMRVLCKPDRGRGDIWIEGIIIKPIPPKNGVAKFKVKLVEGPKDNGTFPENCLAPIVQPTRENLYVGSRVIAERPSETIDPQRSAKAKDHGTSEVLYGGIVAEKACEANKHRYLVIFDDGFAQYVIKKKLFHVPFPALEVWDDLPGNIRHFAQEYLEEYPWRPLLKVKVGETIVTEWNGKWLKAKVSAVDCSLVKVLFEIDNRTEMIYRGSSRLEPLMKELDRRDLEAAQSKQKKKKIQSQEKIKKEANVDFMITRFCYGVSPYSSTDPEGHQQLQEWGEQKPKYANWLFNLPSSNSAQDETRKRKLSNSSQDKFDELHRSFSQSSETSVSSSNSRSSSCSLDIAVTAASQLSALMHERSPKAVSSKSSTGSSSPGTIVSSEKPAKLRPRHPKRFCSLHEYKTKAPSEMSNDTKLAGSHTCGVSCKLKVFISQKEKSKHNFLAIPMLLGWTRESAKRKPGYHRDVYYRSPCKRRLRNIEEVAKFLCDTKVKNVTIDQFSFDSSVSCRDQGYTFPDAQVFIDDLSGGLERVPVQCVNEINSARPPPVIYTSTRLPSEGVTVNTDPGFLPCCSCKDNCEDKTKCACAKLTIDGSNAIDNIKDGSTGYRFRRLVNCMPTGLYECNVNCSCSKGCFNRVVQNGITLRLQIFMTESKGWGLRCLDDIPEGTFICTYAGQILNEDMANKEGTDFGDEYLAELDHIESVEIAKEGYEATVPELENNTEDQSPDIPSQTTPDSSRQPKRRRLTEEDDTEDDSQMHHDEGQAAPRNRLQSQADGSDSPEAATMVIDLTSDDGDISAPDEPRITESKKIVMAQSSSLRLMIDKLKSQVKVEALPVKPKQSENEAPPSPTPVSFGVSSSSETTVDSCQPPRDFPSRETQRATALSEKVLQMLQKEKKPRALACKSTSASAFKMFSSPRSSTGAFLRRRNPVVPLVIIQESPDRATDQPKPSPNERKSTRRFFGEDYCYVIDAKSVGNAGRYINHSCSPNLFVQNVFVDTHDLRFPWVAFFSQRNIPSLTELTWDYSYDVGSVRDKIIKCNCGSLECRGRLL